VSIFSVPLRPQRMTPRMESSTAHGFGAPSTRLAIAGRLAGQPPAGAPPGPPASGSSPGPAHGDEPRRCGDGFSPKF